MKKKPFILSLCSISIILLNACTADKLVEPAPPTLIQMTLCDSVQITSTSHIDAMFGKSCSGSGCHDALNPLSAFTNAAIYKRVAEDRDMPPIYDTQNRTMSTLQLDSLKCWKDGGFQ